MKKNKGALVAYARKDKLMAKAAAWMQNKGVVTRKELTAWIHGQGKTIKRAGYAVSHLLSPRKESSERGKFGNCLGNPSADGVHYYMIPLKKDKVGDDKRFEFHACSASEVKAREEIAAKRKVGKVGKTKKVKAAKVAKPKVAKPSKTGKPRGRPRKVVPTAPVTDTPAPEAKVETPVVAEVAAVATPVTPAVETPAPVAETVPVAPADTPANQE